MARSPWRTLTAPGVCFPFPWTESSGRSKRGRGPVVPSRFWCARGGALPTWDGLGQAVSEAQRAVAAHAIGNYLAYFRRGPADQDGGAGYTPNTTSILFPPSTGGEEGARVAVPLVTLAHHNAVGLDSVRIKLCAAAAVDEEEKLLLDFSPPGRASGEPPLLTEMELCFRCDDPPEGTARVTTEMNKSL